MTTTPSTHTGTCQACGRRQAVHINTGMIAKHGYTTDYGYFNGVCGGSDHLPLELDTAVNIAVVAGMIAFAAEQDATADGEITHVQAEVGPYLRNNRGTRYRERKLVDRAEFVATQPAYADFDREVESIRRSLRRTAESVRADAAVLDGLRDKVHGQPLQARVVEAEIKREQFRSYREAYARVEELKAAGHKAQSRRSFGGFNVTYR
jgi:hypothetical protein